MADITLTCGTCGNRITVSEYVDAEFMTCMKCRTKVPVPAKKPEQTAAARLKLAPSMVATPTPATPTATDGAPPKTDRVRQNMPFIKRLRRRRPSAVGLGVTVAAYALFAALVGGLLYLRFSPHALPPGKVELLTAGALWVLVALHLSTIVAAFADDAFYGIMALIIPGYTIYYLFVQSDRFFQRALAAALLVAFGLDASRVIQGYTRAFYVGASNWMQHAGDAKQIEAPAPR